MKRVIQLEQLELIEHKVKAPDVAEVLAVLRKLRVNYIREEYELQNEIAKLLEDHNVPFIKEYKLGPRNRVDFYINGIVLEIKKAKPNRERVIRQLMRYAEYEEVTGLILVIERSMDIPDEINSKKCISFGLNKQWGIAL